MTPRTARRRAAILSIAAIAAIVAAAIGVLLLLGPAPPRAITMATGPEGSAKAVFGARYRALLAQHRVELRLVETQGGVENLRLLGDAGSGVSVAFVESGLTSAAEAPELASLGTLFYEPAWLFYRGAPLQRRSADMLKGMRMSIGPEGSGTRALALELLGALGIDKRDLSLLGLPPREAGAALLRGEIDMAVIVAPWESPVVRELLASEQIEALPFPRADAHVALRPYLTKLTVPQGVADLAKNRPPADLVLVGPKGSLIVRNDLHPALQYLLLDAASQIHSAPGLFQKAGQFPAPEPIDLPLSPDARHFYQSGAPFLQRYLPFWMAVFAARLLLLLIPVVGVAYPLLRLLPAVYAWGMRRRIFRLYGELKFLEAALEARPGQELVDDLLADITKLEERANHLRVPLAFAHMLYTLRLHIGLVRGRLERRLSSPLEPRRP